MKDLPDSKKNIIGTQLRAHSKPSNNTIVLCVLCSLRVYMKACPLYATDDCRKSSVSRTAVRLITVVFPVRRALHFTQCNIPNFTVNSTPRTVNYDSEFYVEINLIKIEGGRGLHILRWDRAKKRDGSPNIFSYILYYDFLTNFCFYLFTC